MASLRTMELSRSMAAWVARTVPLLGTSRPRSLAWGLQNEGRPRVEGQPRYCTRLHRHHKHNATRIKLCVEIPPTPTADHISSSVRSEASEPKRLWKPSRGRKGTSCWVGQQGPGTRAPPIAALRVSALGVHTRLSCGTSL